MEALPVILGTVSLLLTVTVVAPLALCCCFRKKRRHFLKIHLREREPLLNEGKRQSYNAASTLSIQSPDQEKVTYVKKTSVPIQIPGASEEPAPQLDEHYLYSLKDYQPFESDTYDGVYSEVLKWVKPLVVNKPLHSAYLSYVTPPRTVEKLQKLSHFLQAYGNAHRAHKSTPAVTYAPMEPVMAALDSEWSVQLDEVSSMIVVSEALAEFPQHIVKKAIELSPEKRTTLVQFIRFTPHGVDKHVYTDEGPFRDPELNPLMTRMGFSIPFRSKKLVLKLGHRKKEDRLVAGLILILSTQPQR